MLVELNILLRSLVFFLILFSLVKLKGGKNITQSPFLFISYTFLGCIAALSAVRVVPNMLHVLIPLVLWAFMLVALDRLSLSSKMLHDFINGKETILIKQGKVMEENLNKARLSGEALLKGLRAKNVFNVADVEFAVLETSGEINIMLKAEKSPLTAKDVGKKVAPRIEPQTVILDGNIVDESLKNAGLTREWLEIELKKAEVSLNNVFLGQVDAMGEIYLDLFDDALQLPQPQVKELLFANLEKSCADLLKYELETKDPEAKEMYSRQAQKVKELIAKLEPLLLR